MVPPPTIAGAKYAGMEACGVCHEKQVKNFKLSYHARVQIPGQEKRGNAYGCETCHGPGSLHVDADDKDKAKTIVNPGKNPEACFQCHLDKKAEFNLQYHHPVIEGKMSCNDCHDPHGENIRKPKGMLISRGINDTCGQCHREQSRPHVFEHEALREGCTVCHNVHGSINEKLLTERNATLCLKCHGQIVASGAAARSIGMGPGSHTSNLATGACFTAGCHTAMHGSNVSSMLRY